VLVVFEPEPTSGRLYRRVVGPRTLTFQPDGPGTIADVETGSVWSAASGRCLRGDLAGAQLKALPAIVSYRDAWLRFHPESNVFAGE